MTGRTDDQRPQPDSVACRLGDQHSQPDSVANRLGDQHSQPDSVASRKGPRHDHAETRSADRTSVDGPAWPRALVRFVELFNAGEFWASHEVLETPWRVNHSDFYQGLIIYASAFVHAQRGNPVGIRKQLAKVPGKLERYRRHYMGVDVDAILAHGRVCTDMVLADPSLRGPALTQAVPYPRLKLDPHLVRGDEPEFYDASEHNLGGGA